MIALYLLFQRQRKPLQTRLERKNEMEASN
jgi:hypothetical protein